MVKTSIKRTLKTEKPTGLKIADTLLVTLSDMHSGGSTALFPNRFVQFKHSNHTPTADQSEMWKHFEKCAEYVKEHRKGKRLILVHDGDAIDGVHHSAIQAVTFIKDEQAELHVELMDYFMRTAQFNGETDKLFYVSGTETHVEDKEEKIAKDLRAVGRRVYDHLEMDINGRLVWFVHHGKQRGRGANEGNSLRNWLRDIYFDCRKLGKRPPDLVISGHTHTPTWNVFIAREKQDFHQLQGVVCPSWQGKTRFAYKVAPVDVNEIGAVFIDIRADGIISMPHFELMETKNERAIKV